MVDITAGTIILGALTITTDLVDMVDLALAWDTDMAVTADIMVTVDMVDTGTTLTMDMAVVTTVVTLNETQLTTKPTDVQILL